MIENNDSYEVLQPGRLFCWLSGWTQSYKPKNWNGPWKLQVAHIASGAGKAVRAQDRRAVIVLSPLCHDLHVSNSDRLPNKKIGNVVYPTFDERHTLFLKKIFDPEYYSEEYLQSIWIGKLPSPEPPPQRWCRELLDNQGILL